MLPRRTHLTFALLLTAGLCAGQDDGSMTNEAKLQLHTRIRSCTVMVRAIFDDEHGAIGTGVGFQRFGDDVVVVTNAHVVGEEGKFVSQKVAVRPWTKGEEVWLPANVIVTSRVDRDFLDIAFLVVSDPRRLIVIASPIEERALKVGKPVYSCGHPRGEEFLVDDGAILEVTAEELVAHDALIEHGNSGGGLFDSKGQLIGINTWMVDGKYGLAQEIHGFLGWWRFFRATARADATDWLETDIEIQDGQFGRALAVGKWSYDGDRNSCNALGSNHNHEVRVDDRYYFASLLVRAGESTVQIRDQWKKNAAQESMYPDYGVQRLGDFGRLKLRINDSQPGDNSGSIDLYVLVIGYPKGYLGVEVAAPSDSERKDLHLAAGTGAKVLRVDPYSPAAGAGIRVGDIILELEVNAAPPVPVNQDTLAKVMLEGWDSVAKSFATVLRDGKKIQNLVIRRHH
ncbi:MAG: 2-alkenal [Planctomycetota bacterium]|nr:MAG: 2-alkenal [Planctomycetota bacterium]